MKIAWLLHINYKSCSKSIICDSVKEISNYLTNTWYPEWENTFSHSILDFFSERSIMYQIKSKRYPITLYHKITIEKIRRYT